MSHQTRRLARKSTSLLAGRLLNFGLQAAYFILLAKLLNDAREYGLFSGVFALVSAVTPYSAAGSAMLFLRYVSCETALAKVYWGNSLLLTLVFTSVTCALAVTLGITSRLLAHPYMTAVLLIANCLFSQLTVLAAMLLFCLNRLKTSAVLSTVSNAARLLVVLMLHAICTQVSASHWAAALTAASLVAAIYSYSKVYDAVGAPTFDLALMRRRLGEGLGFSFAGSTEAVNNDVDKLMLVYFGLTLQNGFYTLAYRVIDFATAPIAAITASVTQRHFQLAYQSPAGVVRLAWRSLLVGVGIGIASILPIWGVARWIPLLVGPTYRGAVQVMYWLCWLPAIRAIHQLAGAAVTGLGRQPLRTTVQVLAAALSVGLNLLWIPKYGWKGAATATLFCDGAMAILNVSALLYLRHFLPLEGRVMKKLVTT